MVAHTHLALSLCSATLFLHTSPLNEGTIFFLSVLGTILPDLNLFGYIIEHRYFNFRFGLESLQHRDNILHKPIFWLTLWVSGQILAVSFGSAVLISIFNIVGLSLLLHFIADSFFFGVPWLWPFDEREFGFYVTHFRRHYDRIAKKFGHNLTIAYLLHPAFWIETTFSLLVFYLWLIRW